MWQNSGTVASLHLHPAQGGESMRAVESIELVAEMGIVGNGRYFGRTSRNTGLPSKRQVTLMEREQIAEHGAVLGLPKIPPGTVRSNMETEGVDLVALIGHQVQVGGAVLFFYEGRKPCEKMDRICPGLRALMEDNHQGVLAQVLRSGTIRIGDGIKPL